MSDVFFDSPVSGSRHLFNPRHGQTRLLSVSTKFNRAISPKFNSARLELLNSGLGQTLRQHNVVSAEEIVSFFGSAPDLDFVSASLKSDKREVEKALRLARKSAPKHVINQFGHGSLQVSPKQYGSTEPIDIEHELEKALESIGNHLVSGEDLTTYTIPHHRKSRMLDQGPRGTCVSIVASFLMEQARIRHGKKHIALSPEYNWWHAKRHDGQPERNETKPTIAFGSLKVHGLCSNYHWPHDPTLEPGMPPDPPPIVLTKNCAVYLASNVYRLQQPTNVDKIKKLIREDHAVGIIIPIFESLSTDIMFQWSGNFVLPYATNEEPIRYHAVAIIGFCEDQDQAGGGYFMIRNSWGRKWGKYSRLGRGHGAIPYRYISEHCRSAYFVET